MNQNIISLKKIWNLIFFSKERKLSFALHFFILFRTITISEFSFLHNHKCLDIFFAWSKTVRRLQTFTTFSSDWLFLQPNMRIIWTRQECMCIKVGKSQRVFSFPTHLKNNEQNHYPSTFPIRLKSWGTFISFFCGRGKDEKSFWDVPTFIIITGVRREDYEH